ncbi:uncharacterized protein N0V89_009571 [Didymosphaeria variabile]|uniref:FAD-binding domain-containing protein n=1 Tax=Didymosphaeria variabile TaxID=1932322 RepID=A0A9W8XEK8_9PLEO|nr:uncharacterized protein N0V89_009571 [Didymosphaeria variabile]KAJ4348199.1 hypothetical protein N0V89_009571 [Didymosphaeria variabile]
MASSLAATSNRQSYVQLDIVIVGAGLGGLAAAISAAQSGHNVVVYEAAKELAEVGAGLQLTPNCTKILQQYGLSDAFWASGAEPTSLSVHRYTGSILAHDEAFSCNIRKRYDAPFLDMHRCDLQKALYERAKALGVDFRFGSRIIDMEFEHARPMVSTEQGCRYADLVVAADGLWSRCRSRFLGRNDPPKPTGDLAYRVVLDIEQIQDPELRRWVSEPTCHFWIGPGAHAVGYSLRGGKMYNIVLLVPDDLPPGVSRQPGSIEEMKALFKGWDPILARFLDLVDIVDKWKLMHQARDALFLSQLGNELKGPFPSRWTCPQVQSWLYGYDAYEEVENAVKADPFPRLSNNQRDEVIEAGWLARLSDWLPLLSGFALAYAALSIRRLHGKVMVQG